MNYAPEDLACLDALHKKVLWLAAWTIHHANYVRPKRDGLKVGGHQASNASLAAVMTVLYFHLLRPRDRVAVKPHASPTFHAIQYLLGHQSREQLERFRAVGGAQSYPSRTKDADDVDFSTGSVGLGVALTAFASLAQDYLSARGWLADKDRGRMIALLGDAELDEGNIYEALIEGYKHELRNTWWVIDYNRQSLDAVTPDRMFARFQDIFRTSGWQVVTIKYGKQQKAAFERPGGHALKDWIDECPNSLYSALTFKGGEAWRAQLLEDKGHVRGFKSLIGDYDDEALQALMINLGGHDLERLLEKFHSVEGDAPHCFITYTIKGWGMPFQGHKDNHAGLMNEAQMAAYQAQMGVPAGQEWEPFAGIESQREQLEGFLAQVPFAKASDRRYDAPRYPVPEPDDFPCPRVEAESTQGAYGRILHQLGGKGYPLADRIVTASPDVTVSTNLGGWVNRRGVHHRKAKADVFVQQNVVSMQRWEMSASGQHMELGIAENNLFLLLAAFGLSGPLFGERLLPIGTLYDTFISRGLDSLNYACYQDARFILVGTPSGVTLAPEGGAHQSIYTPLIGMGQDGLIYFEPAYVDELAEIMRWSFEHIQKPDGSSVYIRLSTRQIPQIARSRTSGWRKDVLRGAYWLHPPTTETRLVIVYAGVVAPDALTAYSQVADTSPGVGLLAITSPDRLHGGWVETLRTRPVYGAAVQSQVERVLAPVPREATLVTVIDGAPETLSWLGAVHGHRVIPLGVDRFGQSADVPDIHALHHIGTEAILAACETAKP